MLASESNPPRLSARPRLGAVLVDVVERAPAQRALVGCDARSGGCEVADLVAMDALVAHP